MTDDANARYKPSPPFRYAGFGVRVWASLLDSIAISIALMPVAWLLSPLFYGNVDSAAVQAKYQELQASGVFTKPSQVMRFFVEEGVAIPFLMSNLFQTVVCAVAVVLLWIRMSATPGKKVLKLAIVDAETGGKPTNLQFIIRYLGYFLSMLPMMFGFLWIIFDRRKQGWHDKLANTVVIEKHTPLKLFKKS